MMNRNGLWLSEAGLAVVRFRNEEVRRACRDLPGVQRRWGHVVARAISRRLQQLEAMSALADLDFLPFESHEHDNGVFEVEVTEDLALFIEGAQDRSEGEALMFAITVMDLRERSTMAATS